MRQPLIIYRCIFLSIAFYCCTGTDSKGKYNGYTVNENLPLLATPSSEKSSKSFLDFKLFENDSLIVDTYGKGARINKCLVSASLDRDTIYISAYAGMFSGLGYHIAIFDNTCLVKHLVKSDLPMYKLNKLDSAKNGLIVPCETYNLTLSRKPTFLKGDSLEGVIELTSKEYIELSYKEEKKYKIKLTGYFKTGPLVFSEKDKMQL